MSGRLSELDYCDPGSLGVGWRQRAASGDIAGSSPQVGKSTRLSFGLVRKRRDNPSLSGSAGGCSGAPLGEVGARWTQIVADTTLRLTWLVRRLRRMYWQEVPFRVATLVRGALQLQGVGTANRLPAASRDARFGVSWCRAPQATSGMEPLRAAVNATLHGRLSVFGQAVPMTDGIPDWHADPVTGRRLPLTFGLFLDFRHIAGLDIKHLWEVNRLGWWVPLAQGWAVWRDQACLDRLSLLLDNWLSANPYAQGANWSSPVEHGIRLINWSLVWHLVGGVESPMFSGAAGQALLGRWLTSIYQHMRFASDNYSFYSSADNHLIGEAAGVFVAAHTWDQWAESRRMRVRARQILEEETLKQFSPDGVNREQALCYHKFSLQFLLASGLCGRVNGDDFSTEFWERVRAALTFQAALTDVGGQVPKFGDSDDGDVWRLASGMADGWHEMLAMGARITGLPALRAKCLALGESVPDLAAWIAPEALPPVSSSLPTADGGLPTSFLEGGYALLGLRLHQPDELRVLVDCGPLGYNRIGGHAHADALAVLVSAAGEALLVDAGTYCYNAAPDLRRYFRGTSAHNTLVVDGEDQAPYGASFLWLRDVNTAVVAADTSDSRSIHAWHDGYERLRDPVRHHRRVTVDADGSVRVEDWLECRASHRVTLLWHAAAGTSLRADDSGSGWVLQGQRRGLLIGVAGPTLGARVVTGRASPPQGWVSETFYSRHEAPVLEIETTLCPGEVLLTTLQCIGPSGT